MKFKFNLMKKEIDFEADIEKLVEKSIDMKSMLPNRKTNYQIRQEEKRKTMELKDKQQKHYLYLMIGVLFLIAVLGVVATILNI